MVARGSYYNVRCATVVSECFVRSFCDAGIAEWWLKYFSVFEAVLKWRVVNERLVVLVDAHLAGWKWATGSVGSAYRWYMQCGLRVNVLGLR